MLPRTALGRRAMAAPPHDSRVILITGASDGIGRAFALLAAQSGARLALVARRRDKLNEVVQEVGGPTQAVAIVANVTRRSEVRRAVAQAVDVYGRIDVIVNNVGRGISRSPSELTDADLDEMMTINVKSALYGMQEVLPHFRAAGHGHIINVSSTLGRRPSVLPRCAYSASKHFLNALTANFRDELAQTQPGVTVSLVSPGLTYTAFGTASLHGGVDSHALPGGQPAHAVAAVIMHVVETRQADVYTTAGHKAQVGAYLDELSSDPPLPPPPVASMSLGRRSVGLVTLAVWVGCLAVLVRMAAPVAGKAALEQLRGSVCTAAPSVAA